MPEQLQNCCWPACGGGRGLRWPITLAPTTNPPSLDRPSRQKVSTTPPRDGNRPRKIETPVHTIQNPSQPTVNSGLYAPAIPLRRNIPSSTSSPASAATKRMRGSGHPEISSDTSSRITKPCRCSSSAHPRARSTNVRRHKRDVHSSRLRQIRQRFARRPYPLHPIQILLLNPAREPRLPASRPCTLGSGAMRHLCNGSAVSLCWLRGSNILNSSYRKR